VGTEISEAKIFKYLQMPLDKINLAPISDNKESQLWFMYSSGGMLSEYKALWQHAEECHRIYAAIKSLVTIPKRYNRSTRNSVDQLLETTCCTYAEVLDQISHGSG